MRSLTGYQNGTFRSNSSSVYRQIHGRSAARTTFSRVSFPNLR